MVRLVLLLTIATLNCAEGRRNTIVRLPRVDIACFD